MIRRSWAAVLLLIGAALFCVKAEAATYPIKAANTDSLFSEVKKQIAEKHIAALPIGERIVAIAKLFLDRPYLEKSLEVGNDTGVVCNFNGFDCVTLFENSWALARFCKRKDTSLQAYAVELSRTRYYDENPSGFQNRIHYTTDYFYVASSKKLLEEVTGKIGGDYTELERKPINFMSTHPSLYAQLKADPQKVEAIKRMEKDLATHGGFYYIRKNNLASVESKIHSGDLIGITTRVPGIDCSHTGIAYKAEDGRIHFLHASSALGKVVISELPLVDYLQKNLPQTGVIIYRPKEVVK